MKINYQGVKIVTLNKILIANAFTVAVILKPIKTNWVVSKCKNQPRFCIPNATTMNYY